MSITNSSIKTLTESKNNKLDHDSDLLAGTVAENLSDGEYVVSAIPHLVIFIRVNDWQPGVEIEEIDFVNTYQIKLSNGRKVNLHKKLIDNSLQNVDGYRIVLLSEYGIGRFKVKID